MNEMLIPSQIRCANDRTTENAWGYNIKKTESNERENDGAQMPAYIFHRIVLCVLGEKLFDAQQDTDALRVNNYSNKIKQQQMKKYEAGKKNRRTRTTKFCIH